MRKSVISLVLIGGFVLVSNLTFAQGMLTAGGEDPTAMNQDTNTQVNSNSNTGSGY